MLAPRGNPSTETFFGIVNALQKKAHVKLRVNSESRGALLKHTCCGTRARLRGGQR